MVQLASLNDVERALQELNSKKIGDRWIKLDRASVLVEVQHGLVDVL